jgi:hydroxymethylpyrimidine pyrophosphatase-like HAD family hydrolase/fructoselysine-6-P-deglycase FrlB-like protein
MGKPYSNELDLLQHTVDWSRSVNIDELAAHVKSAQGRPLFSVGSGGSLAAAHFQALLHQQSGAITRAVTPVELYGCLNTLCEAAVFFLSAGGSNPDVLSAYRQAALNEPRSLGGLCLSLGSPLKSLAEQFQFSKLMDFDLPAGKDGFLATNSLLALMVLLARAYQSGDFSDNGTDAQLDVSGRLDIEQRSRAMRPDDSWLILYGGWCQPAASDLESKMSEAALAHGHLSDYRNFAHGRHHWLAKRGSNTSVVALSTPAERTLAERTLAMLPRDIPVLRLETEATGPKGTIDLLVSVLYFVRVLGERRGIDPGRPGVPEFGRRIYNLKYVPQSQKFTDLTLGEAVAIRRKIRPCDINALSASQREAWGKALRVFKKQLTSKRFGAVVFDYDGTLCYTPDRFRPLSEPIMEQLTRLLEAGVIIGIATGRGKSARKELLSLPDRFHNRVYIGYHNGGEIRILTEEPPTSDCDPCGELIPVLESIKLAPSLKGLFKLTPSEHQLTFEALGDVDGAQLSEVLRLHIDKHAAGCQMVISSHSVDILAPGISKVVLVDQIRSMIKGSAEVLCIGDKGRWPGNDYALLNEPLSLSVDEVSGSRETCWNLAPAGHVGLQATLTYLRSLNTMNDGTVKFVGKARE